MQSKLDELIQKAFESSGAVADVNKVYLTFLGTELYIPAEIHDDNAGDEPFTPIFAMADEMIFMTAFDSKERLQEWAGENLEHFDYVSVMGRDLIKAIGENVFLALNPGSNFYKEFSPEEILHLKTMIAKVEALSEKKH